MLRLQDAIAYFAKSLVPSLKQTVQEVLGELMMNKFDFTEPKAPTPKLSASIAKGGLDYSKWEDLSDDEEEVAQKAVEAEQAMQMQMQMEADGITFGPDGRPIGPDGKLLEIGPGGVISGYPGSFGGSR